MTTEKPNPNPYSPIPATEPPHLRYSPILTEPPHYVILQYYRNHNHNHYPYLRWILLLTFTLLTLSLFLYLTYPSDPDLQMTRVKLNHIRIHTHPFPPSLSFSLSVTLRVRNRNLFSLWYRTLDVAVSYRGRTLGFLSSHGNEIKAKQSSYVDADLVVDGLEVLHDLIYLIEDVASGFVAFDTVSAVSGRLRFFFLEIPVKAKVSCEVDVNPMNQKIIHQNCYPELREAESPLPS